MAHTWGARQSRRVTSAVPVLPLPLGWAVRRPSPEDVDLLFRLVADADTALLGKPDATRDDVSYWLNDPDVDLSRDAWTVVDTTGAAHAWGWVAAARGSSHVDLDYYVDASARPLLGELLGLLEQRAAELAGDAASVTVDKALYRQDQAGACLLRNRGYRLATTFNRMRVELDGPVDSVTPPGVVVRRVVGRDADDGLRTAHAIREASFSDHFGHTPRPYDEWLAHLDARTDVDWEQLWLADVDGRPAGMLLGTEQYAGPENAGFVLSLGVLAEARGRGVAKALLHTHFAEQQRRGRASVLLHVDTANVTGALRLYELVGMRPDMQMDVWRRELVTARP